MDFTRNASRIVDWIARFAFFLFIGSQQAVFAHDCISINVEPRNQERLNIQEEIHVINLDESPAQVLRVEKTNENDNLLIEFNEGVPVYYGTIVASQGKGTNASVFPYGFLGQVVERTSDGRIITLKSIPLEDALEEIIIDDWVKIRVAVCGDRNHSNPAGDAHNLRVQSTDRLGCDNGNQGYRIDASRIHTPVQGIYVNLDYGSLIVIERIYGDPQRENEWPYKIRGEYCDKGSIGLAVSTEISEEIMLWDKSYGPYYLNIGPLPVVMWATADLSLAGGIENSITWNPLFEYRNKLSGQFPGSGTTEQQPNNELRFMFHEQNGQAVNTLTVSLIPRIKLDFYNRGGPYLKGDIKGTWSTASAMGQSPNSSGGLGVSLYAGVEYKPFFGEPEKVFEQEIYEGECSINASSSDADPCVDPEVSNRNEGI